MAYREPVKSTYSPMTRGMQVQAAEQGRELLNMQGDLMAISILRERSRFPLKHADDDPFYRNTITFEGKKKLWNAQSRLISRVTAKLFQVENPNALESILARELIGLASIGLVSR